MSIPKYQLKNCTYRKKTFNSDKMFPVQQIYNITSSRTINFIGFFLFYFKLVFFFTMAFCNLQNWSMYDPINLDQLFCLEEDFLAVMLMLGISPALP